MKTIKKELILIVFLLPLIGFTQNDSVALNDKQQTAFKNQMDLDVQFLGIEFLYKHKLSKNLFVGSGVGLGAIVSFSKNGTFAEFLRIKLLFDYQFNKKFHIYQGSTVSILTYDSSNDNYIQTLKIGIGIFYKISTIEIGVEPSIVLSRSGLELATSLIVLKIPLKRW